MQGWGSEHQFFDAIIKAVRPTTILEIGTWKGMSAMHMAKVCRSLSLNTEIVCIDTWLGSSEHTLVPQYYNSLKHVNGYPSVYYTFMKNVLYQGLQDYITPFAIASESAALVLKQFEARADLIYIDAAHEYDAVYRDAEAFWPLLSDRGIMLFDDYGYSDVTKATCAFAAAKGVALYASFGKAFLTKGSFKPTLTLSSL
jgi:predicted O-methyltransferase YrrM